MIAVSVIMPVFNSAKFLDLAVRSILSQNFHDWECIIVDDCSVDGSVDIARSCCERDSRIRLICLDVNSGAAAARNAGTEVAQGRYIAFLDSDDIWLPDKLQRQLAFMEEKKAALTFSAYERINEVGRVLGGMSVPPQVSYRQLLRTNVIGCLTVIYDVALLGKVYMPLDTEREDFATWLSILKRTDYAYGLTEVLARYRVYAGQSSAKKLQMAFRTWKLYRQLEGVSLVEAVYYFSHYLVRGVLRTNNFLRKSE